jgi:hypothetical protein
MNGLKYVVMCGFAGLIMSCDKNDKPEPVKDPVISETVNDLAANASDAPSGGHYTFFSFKDGLVNASDSASNAWDIAFRSTSIIVNGGTSGPGTATAAISEGIFSEFSEVPTGLNMAFDSESGLAIPTGSGNGWYSYNPSNHEISPIAGKVIFVKGADGNYSKVEILSYYKGAPESYVPGSSIGRYYTFRYVYQPDGTTDFQ